MTRQFRFRPRLRALVLSTMTLAVLLGVVGALIAAWAMVGLAAVMLVIGGLYLRSPVWRLVVTVDDDGLAVTGPDRPRFRVAWTAIVRVVASPTTGTCFVDGGRPEHSLLVPGDGAPASYDLEDKAALYAAILAATPADRVTEVARLDTVAT